MSKPHTDKVLRDDQKNSGRRHLRTWQRRQNKLQEAFMSAFPGFEHARRRKQMLQASAFRKTRDVLARRRKAAIRGDTAREVCGNTIGNGITAKIDSKDQSARKHVPKKAFMHVIDTPDNERQNGTFGGAPHVPFQAEDPQVNDGRSQHAGRDARDTGSVPKCMRREGRGNKDDKGTVERKAFSAVTPTETPHKVQGPGEYACGEANVRTSQNHADSKLQETQEKVPEIAHVGGNLGENQSKSQQVRQRITETTFRPVGLDRKLIHDDAVRPTDPQSRPTLRSSQQESPQIPKTENLHVERPDPQGTQECQGKRQQERRKSSHAMGLGSERSTTKTQRASETSENASKYRRRFQDDDLWDEEHRPRKRPRSTYHEQGRQKSPRSSARDFRPQRYRPTGRRIEIEREAISRRVSKPESCHSDGLEMRYGSAGGRQGRSGLDPRSSIINGPGPNKALASGRSNGIESPGPSRDTPESDGASPRRSPPANLGKNPTCKSTKVGILDHILANWGDSSSSDSDCETEKEKEEAACGLDGSIPAAAPSAVDKPPSENPHSATRKDPHSSLDMKAECPTGAEDGQKQLDKARMASGKVCAEGMPVPPAKEPQYPLDSEVRSTAGPEIGVKPSGSTSHAAGRAPTREMSLGAERDPKSSPNMEDGKPVTAEDSTRHSGTELDKEEQPSSRKVGDSEDVNNVRGGLGVEVWQGRADGDLMLNGESVHPCLHGMRESFLETCKRFLAIAAGRTKEGIFLKVRLVPAIDLAAFGPTYAFRCHNANHALGGEVAAKTCLVVAESSVLTPRATQELEKHVDTVLSDTAFLEAVENECGGRTRMSSFDLFLVEENALENVKDLFTSIRTTQPVFAIPAGSRQRFVTQDMRHTTFFYRQNKNREVNVRLGMASHLDAFTLVENAASVVSGLLNNVLFKPVIVGFDLASTSNCAGVRKLLDIKTQVQVDRLVRAERRNTGLTAILKEDPELRKALRIKENRLLAGRDCELVEDRFTSNYERNILSDGGVEIDLDQSGSDVDDDSDDHAIERQHEPDDYDLDDGWVAPDEEVEEEERQARLKRRYARIKKRRKRRELLIRKTRRLEVSDVED